MNLSDLLKVSAGYRFYIQLGLALFTFIFFIILSKTLRKATLKFFGHFSNKIPNFLDELTTALSKPLDYWWILTGLYVGLLISPFVYYPHFKQSELIINENLVINLALIPYSFVNLGYTVCFILLLTWGAYNCVDIYEQILVNIGSKFTLLDHSLLIRFTSRIIKLMIIIIGSALIIVQFDINIAGIFTGVGLGGVAFTFVAKDTLTNIMSGVVLMIDRPFTIGDWIECGSIEGIIEDVSFRSTRIRTFEQGLVIVPNATLSNDNILNWSTMPKRRAKFTLGVAYDTSKEQLENFITQIKETLEQMEEIEKNTYLVYFKDFGDYSLNIEIMYYTFQTGLKDYTALKEVINLKIMDLASQLHVEMAFPTQTIKMQP